MTRFDVLSHRISDLLAEIAVERQARRSTHGLETMLRKARSERMKLGLKIARKQKGIAA